MKRKNQHLDSYNCVLCNNNSKETMEHLFFSCPFAQWCWRFVNLQWSITPEVIDRVEEAANNNQSQIFKELLIVCAWIIWKHRNGIIFDGRNPLVNAWKKELKIKMELTIIKAKGVKKQLLKQWLDSFS